MVIATGPCAAQRVHVYRNLNKPGVVWSVRSAQTGLVVGHVDYIGLRCAAFRVQPSGRKRVLLEGRKNVHAYVSGIPTDVESITAWRRGIYDPYRFECFVDGETGERIPDDVLAVLDVSGLRWAFP